MQCPKIAVIILHFLHISDTMECLDSLQKTTYQNKHIYLVSNSSEQHDALALQLQKIFAPITFIPNEKNYGFAEGMNIGIRHSLRDPLVQYVFILNNDTTLEESFFEHILRTRGDLVAPKVIQYEDTTKIDSMGVNFSFGLIPNNRRSEKKALFCPTGSAALYSRTLLETCKDEYGYFDRRFFCYMEDVDLGIRCRKNGFTASYAPSAVMYHKGSQAYGKYSDFMVYQSFRNLFWIYEKHAFRKQFAFFPFMIMTHVAILLFLIRHKKLHLLKKIYGQKKKLTK